MSTKAFDSIEARKNAAERHYAESRAKLAAAGREVAAARKKLRELQREFVQSVERGEHRAENRYGSPHRPVVRQAGEHRTDPRYAKRAAAEAELMQGKYA